MHVKQNVHAYTYIYIYIVNATTNTFGSRRYVDPMLGSKNIRRDIHRNIYQEILVHQQQSIIFIYYSRLPYFYEERANNLRTKLNHGVEQKISAYFRFVFVSAYSDNDSIL